MTALWRLPEDLEILHDAVITYGLSVHKAAQTNFERQHNGPLSYGALFSLHWRAIVVHRSVRALCETGWTPTTPMAIRTLLDILASCYAIAAEPEDAEYMSFKFMGSYLIESVRDADTSEALRKENNRQLEGLHRQLRGRDVKRAEELFQDYAPRSYWYKPEFSGPAAILKMAKSDLYFSYRQFSGSVHGGFLGSLLFDDLPDMADINPREHPRASRMAIFVSSRLLLDISFMRGQFEGVSEIDEYRKILREMVLPQQEKMGLVPH